MQPFQSLACCPSISKDRSSLLLAASGPYIYSFDAQDGSFLSSWPSQALESKTVALAEDNTSTNDCRSTELERPPKRRRTSLARAVSSSTSAEILVESQVETGSNSATQESNADVSKLLCTSNGDHVIAVTGEDKAIRVFQRGDDGSLTQISERQMPKRPCAIALTPDGSTIICGDKFGDVYSLPLLGKSYEGKSDAATEKSKVPNAQTETEDPFVPAASSRTVHTKKNKEALRNQQKQNNLKKEQKVVLFESKLLLGHVSLLTDLLCVELHGDDSPSSRRREYIITSDRDEHIRISRGIPQAHITEGYCQGHNDFISKICVLKNKRQLLISGGGDGQLLVWDWLQYKIRQRIDLKEYVNRLRENYRQHASTAANGNNEQNITVSGIWSLSDSHVIVACEGVPAILSFPVTGNMDLAPCKCIATDHNIVDLTVIDGNESILYSMDIYHEPFSTKIKSEKTKLKSGNNFGSTRLGNLGGDRITHKYQSIAGALNEWAQSQRLESQTECKPYSYSLESLRKRGQEDEA